MDRLFPDLGSIKETSYVPFKAEVGIWRLYVLPFWRITLR